MYEMVISAGVPFAQAFIVRGGKTVWTALDQFEIRAQLRTGPSTADLLIANLHDYMGSHYDGNDIFITLSLTGSQTRELFEKRWGNNKSGYVDIEVSDVGTTDARLIRVPTIRFRAKDTTTTAAGAT